MITTYQANALLNYNFGRTQYQLPQSYYIGLSTTNISEDGTGVTEPTDKAYSRIKVDNNKVNFSVSAQKELHITQELAFPEAEEAWGTITDIFIADSSTGGNILYYDVLSVQRNIEVGYEVLFPVESIKIKLTSCEVNP